MIYCPTRLAGDVFWRPEGRVGVPIDGEVEEERVGFLILLVFIEAYRVPENNSAIGMCAQVKGS